MTAPTLVPQRPMARRAARSEGAHIAAVLGLAFHDDPVFRWIVPDDARRRRITPEFFSVYNATLLGYDQSYVDTDGFGAVLWAPPGRPVVDETEAFGRALDELFGVDAARLYEIVALLDAHHPHGPPHFYLQWAGVVPQRQGQGIGSALLRPVLERCDRDRVPAYTEATSRRNMRLYARHGFRFLDEIAPAGGPPLFRMWREPAAV